MMVLIQGEKIMEKMYITAKDIVGITGVCLNQAYTIIRKLNAELEKKGMITIRGKVPRKYFAERTGNV